MKELTAEIAREFLEYSPSTGELKWKISPSIRIKAGEIAGSDDGDGYIQICISGKRYKAHRLAWLIVTGSWPKEQIDHINGSRSDNRWGNLRSVTRHQNSLNKAIQINNTSGCLGVYKSSTGGKWVAQINIKGKRIRLGSFDDFEKAVAARKMAEKLNGFHINHGRA